ncbi:CCHC-type domain-containing protein, partial [Durusdinium trenchii]
GDRSGRLREETHVFSFDLAGGTYRTSCAQSGVAVRFCRTLKKVSKIDPAKLKSNGGCEAILAALGMQWGRFLNEDRYVKFERALFLTTQKPDESNDRFIARHEACFEEILQKDKGVTLEEIRAYVMIRHSQLTSEEKKKIIIDNKGVLTYEATREAMRLLGSRFFQDLQGGSNRKLKTYDVHTVDETEPVMMTTEETFDEEHTEMATMAEDFTEMTPEELPEDLLEPYFSSETGFMPTRHLEEDFDEAILDTGASRTIIGSDRASGDLGSYTPTENDMEVDGVEVPIPDENDDDELCVFGDDVLATFDPPMYEISFRDGPVFQGDRCEEIHIVWDTFGVTNAKKERVELRWEDLSEKDKVLFRAAKDKEIQAWLQHDTVKRVLEKIQKVYSFGAFHKKNFVFCGARYFQWDDGSIELDQREYIERINPIQIPKHRRNEPLSVVTEGERQEIRQLCGSLQY